MIVPEEEIGISVFWTEDTPGIGGKLKIAPDDFVVDEISILPPEDPEGKITAAIVKHRNWEHNRLVRRFSTNLRISRNRIAFAGTKDKRSIATQLMTFQVPLEALSTVSIPGVEFLKMYRTSAGTKLGSLIGNKFRILVREVDPQGLEARLAEVTERITALKGFPNFFGVQRFGVTRPITHLIGEAMVRGDFERAVMTYLSDDTEYENEACREARKFISETRDFRKAIEIFPDSLTFERTMISHLMKEPEDFPGALKMLPKNLIMMFIHAYQSFLFNRILSERIKRKMPIDSAVEGDLVLPLDKNGLPDHRRYVPVTAENLGRVNEQISEGKGFVSGSLFGAEPVVAEGPMGEIERRIIESEKLEANDFIVTDVMEATSKGIRRELVSPVRDFQYSLDENGVLFSFSLNKGCYATCLLREYMKSPMINY